MKFPHEIGIFLGYPLADVAGFIRNKGRNCKCIGTWKVYGDAFEKDSKPKPYWALHSDETEKEVCTVKK